MADTLKVGLVSRTFFHLPLWAAMENGGLAAENLDVTTEIFGNAPQTPPLLDGSLQALIGGPEAVLHNVNAGGALRPYRGHARRDVRHPQHGREHVFQLKEMTSWCPPQSDGELMTEK